MFTSANCLLFLVIFYGVQTQGAVKIEFLSLRRFLFFHFPSFCHVQYLFMWCICRKFSNFIVMQVLQFHCYRLPAKYPHLELLSSTKVYVYPALQNMLIASMHLNIEYTGHRALFFRLKIKYLILNRCIFVPKFEIHPRNPTVWLLENLFECIISKLKTPM